MKKLLSLILAAALVIGLVPSVFALEANTAVQESNEWVFTAASHGHTKDTRLYASETKTMNFHLEDTNLDVSDKWAFVNLGAGSEYVAGSDYFNWAYNLLVTDKDVVPENPNPVPKPDSSAAIVFELAPDTYGNLTPSVTYVTHTASPIYEVYLMEKPNDAAEISMNDGSAFGSESKIISFVRNLDHSKRIGMFDAYGNGEVKTASFPKFKVEEGKRYWVVFSANGANPNRVSQTSTASGGRPAYQGTLYLKSFKLTDIKSTNERPTLTYNISSSVIPSDTFAEIAVAQSTAASGNSNSIDNWEIALVSWRDVYYISSSRNLVKKNSSTAGVTKSGRTLDLSLTDPYELQGRSGNDNSPKLSREGLVSQYILKTWEADGVTLKDNILGGTIVNRPRNIVRINVPYAGKYNLSVLNNFTTSSAEIQTAYRRNGKAGGDFTRGIFTKVHVAKADFELIQTSTGYPNNSEAQFNSILNDSTFVGWYDSRALNQKSSIGVVDFPTAGEYFVSFNSSEESLTKNADVYHRNQTSVYKDYQMFLLSGIELTPVENAELDALDKDHDSIVNVNPGNATEKAPANTTSNVQILCGVDKSVLDTKDVAAGTDITYTAPKKEGHTFLYWAQGIGDYKKIVSYEELLSVKAEKGPMWLTAVYADDSVTKTDVVFYNANGDEISRSQYNEGDAITLPAFPSMAGFETATGWTLDKDGETYTADDEVKASGKLMRFVAEYADDPSESFDITVVDGTADNATPVYGETVTVTATPRSGAKLFNYWQKAGEIVSFDLSYSFKAWKDTTVKAVYNDYLPVADTVRKIIMGTRLVGEETAAVAEFIGISDVIEKGILFGTDIDNATHKVSMKTDGDTFSVIDDVVGEAIGYAILANGNVIYSK